MSIQSAPTTVDTLDLIRKKALREKLGVSDSTFWRMRKDDPTFPKPVSISKGIEAFRMPDIRAWLETRSGR
jgi:prophage regulatory protein